MQRYPICWSGDPKCTFESMAHVLRGGLSMGLSGVPFWSHDIGGHVVEPTPELFVRWAQFGMFSAHARTLGVMRRAPWDFGDEALGIFRRYVKLRYRLIPYIYTYAHVAARSGLPLIRAMVLEYQDDPSTHHLDLQYMFGGELLVAPIFDTTGERSVGSARAVTLNGRDLPSLSEPAPGAHGFFIDRGRLVAGFAGAGRTPSYRRTMSRPLLLGVSRPRRCTCLWHRCCWQSDHRVATRWRRR